MKMNHRNTLITIMMIIAGLLLLAGCTRENASQEPPRPGIPEVAVVTIQSQHLVVTNELPGRTSASLVAEVRPQVSGIIQERHFREGSDVKAGQVLFQIDPALFQAALDNAEAGLCRAKANLSAIRLKVNRLRELLADNAVSRQDYDDAAAALNQTEADIRYWEATVKTARINLKYTSVTAPISGRIGRSNITKGALVTAQQPTPLATIQQLDPMFVDVPQSTAQLLLLHRRMEQNQLDTEEQTKNTVRLIMEDGTMYPSKGRLKFRDVTVDPSTGSVIVRAVFPNPDNVLLPGMFVRAVVEEGIDKNAILAPQQGVSRDLKGNPYALIVDAEDTVQKRMLTLSRTVGHQWLVSSGLEAGDRVIVEGIQKVRSGDKVKIVPYDPKGGKKNTDANTTSPASQLN